MIVSMIGFWGLLIALTAVLLRRLGPSGGPSDRPPEQRPSAEEVLAERLASGEIDADEYRQRLQVLREGGGSR